jgi:hypothetical protein
MDRPALGDPTTTLGQLPERRSGGGNIDRILTMIRPTKEAGIAGKEFFCLACIGAVAICELIVL